jgi:predicted RNA-binding Zn-ribbon protein involved in translation (DUF1610 family)
MRSHFRTRLGPKICVKVGSVAASCPACGTAEFRVVRGHKALAVYQCCGCGAETTRTQLVVQISEKLVERSRNLLQGP